MTAKLPTTPGEMVSASFPTCGVGRRNHRQALLDLIGQDADYLAHVADLLVAGHGDQPEIDRLVLLFSVARDVVVSGINAYRLLDPPLTPRRRNLSRLASGTVPSELVDALSIEGEPAIRAAAEAVLRADDRVWPVLVWATRKVSA